MWVRAESDLLSPFLHLTLHAIRVFPGVGDHMRRFWSSVYATIEDRDLLMRDPYAIPTTRPRLPSATLRGFVIPSLKRIMKNEHFRQLVQASNDPQQDLIMQCLRSADPLDVKIISVLFAATPQGWLEEITRKFENARSNRSIYEIVILRYGKLTANKILKKVKKSEQILQQWRVSKLRGRQVSGEVDFSFLQDDCPALFASRVRNHFWNANVVGI